MYERIDSQVLIFSTRDNRKCGKQCFLALRFDVKLQKYFACNSLCLIVRSEIDKSEKNKMLKNQVENAMLTNKKHSIGLSIRFGKFRFTFLFSLWSFENKRKYNGTT